MSAKPTENLFRTGPSGSGRCATSRVARNRWAIFPSPGKSPTLLDHPDPGEAPAWADGTPVGLAYAALLRAALAGSAGLLDADDQDVVEQTLSDWDGAHPPITPDAFPDRRERPGARLALLAALAPYRITDEDVAAWRRPEHTDRCLVRLVAYGAFAAVDRIESALNLPVGPISRT